ncbi:MAG: TlyA family RNA methyltransferase [Firmicutes bacterium]|nr:TlyA family RNA methyltransferase [Bacillota bacterium]
MNKERIDTMLASNGYFESRQKAQAEIMAGNILVNNQKITKPGTVIDTDSEITILKKDFPYVSRGALKLLKAIDEYSINVKNKMCLDIGASTGGFTEILLIKGAKKVFAVDVGHNQLDWKLRSDSRVISMEKVNGRYLTQEDLENSLMDIIVTDVSFISLEKILPAASSCLKSDGEIIALIKPQFEAGHGEVSKKGVVTNKAIHLKVIKKIIEYSISLGLSVKGIEKSPIKGPKGNIEFLIYLIKEENPQIIDTFDDKTIMQIIEKEQ